MAITADFSWARMTPAQIKQAGFAGVLRYVDYGQGNGKVISKAEYQELTAAGITVVLNFEDTANRAVTGGFAAGVADATYTEAVAAQLGYPADGVVYYSVDCDASPSSVLAYFQGIAHAVAGVHRRRPYGGADLINLCVAQGIADGGWITNADSWSHGATTTKACLHQKTSHSVSVAGLADDQWDESDVLRSDWARVSSVAPSQAQPTAPVTEESDDDDTVAAPFVFQTPAGIGVVNQVGEFYTPSNSSHPSFGALNAHAGVKWNLNIVADASVKGPDGRPSNKGTTKVVGAGPINGDGKGGYWIAVTDPKFASGGSPYRTYNFPSTGVSKGDTAF